MMLIQYESGLMLLEYRMVISEKLQSIFSLSKITFQCILNSYLILMLSSYLELARVGGDNLSPNLFNLPKVGSVIDPSIC